MAVAVVVAVAVAVVARGIGVRGQAQGRAVSASVWEIPREIRSNGKKRQQLTLQAPVMDDLDASSTAGTPRPQGDGKQRGYWGQIYGLLHMVGAIGFVFCTTASVILQEPTESVIVVPFAAGSFSFFCLLGYLTETTSLSSTCCAGGSCPGTPSSTTPSTCISSACRWTPTWSRVPPQARARVYTRVAASAA